MSYRDLRNFTEMMRALGYTRLISMENFRTPNFPLIAEILVWLVKRFDPDSDVPQKFDTEENRVLLIRSVAHFMAIKANIMLNTKRLYQADGYAVKEILKITTLLYQAIKANENTSSQLDFRLNSEMHDISSQIEQLKASRELSSQVTSKGSVLYELLGKEVDLRELRNSSVNNQLELTNIENGLKQALAVAKDNISNIKLLIENVAETETNLDGKIEKKQAELERNQKRLLTLKKVRPAFLEEFEKLEIELQSLYQEYIVRVRCISYLEQVQEEASAMEQERMLKRQKETRKIMEEMQLEDARKLVENDLGQEEASEIVEANKPAQPTQRLRTATATKARIMTGHKRVFGGMNVDDEDSQESDSDLLLDDDEDNSELIGSGEELNGLPAESNLSGQSDDDF